MVEMNAQQFFDEWVRQMNKKPRYYKVGTGERWKYLAELENWGKKQYLEEDASGWVDADEVARRVATGLPPSEYRRRARKHEAKRRATLVTAEEAAARFDKSRQWFDKMRRQREPFPFPASVGGRPAKWRLGEIEDWLLARQLHYERPWLGVFAHLNAVGGGRRREVRLTFGDVASLRARGLPRAAFERKGWWFEDPYKKQTRWQARWEVHRVDLREGEVTFREVGGIRRARAT